MDAREAMVQRAHDMVRARLGLRPETRLDNIIFPCGCVWIMNDRSVLMHWRCCHER